MSDAEDIRARMEALQAQLHKVYRVGGRDLAGALRNARRLLPRDLRRDGAALVAAEAHFGHPKLEAMVDFEALRRAHQRISDHLSGVDVADLRRGRVLSVLGVVAFNLILAVAGLGVWLIWSGRL